MEFQGKGHPLSSEGLDQVCQTLGVAQAEVWTVLIVETRGFGFLNDRRPQILYERHWFHKLTIGKYNDAPQDISSKKSGGYAGGSAEYLRLEKALQLDRQAALKSASWGVGQVMGFNHAIVGYDSVEAFVAAMVDDEDRQLLAMARFVESRNLVNALQKHKWEDFARGYNGESFAKNNYDVKLSETYTKIKDKLPSLPLRTAQAALLYQGIDPGPVDGFDGSKTKKALVRFQEICKLPPTGQLDEASEARLLELAFPEA
jgi:hypothetical protein